MLADTILQLIDRVQGAFLESPDLRVTFQQAQQIWRMDELTARQILDALVETHFLSYSEDGEFIRVTTCGVWGKPSHP